MLSIESHHDEERQPEMNFNILPGPEILEVEQHSVPQLDPDVLMALGESVEDAPKFGPPIHENLAKIWQQILKKGLTKESKEKIMKNYTIPENCPLLQAPNLNAEIAAAITEMSKNRDKKIKMAQQQLGVGLTAINQALTLLITSDDKVPVQAIKMISDGCRILSDLHFMETQARTKLLVPGLEKSFLNILKDTERDDTLFGSKLSDQIRASKAVEKQGLQIKKTVIPPKTPVTTVQSTIGRPRYQENWTGPPRYAPSNRGGRGGYRKTNPVHRRPPLLPQNQNKLSNPNKPRVPTQ